MAALRQAGFLVFAPAGRKEWGILPQGAEAPAKIARRALAARIRSLELLGNQAPQEEGDLADAIPPFSLADRTHIDGPAGFVEGSIQPVEPRQRTQVGALDRLRAHMVLDPLRPL